MVSFNLNQNVFVKLTSLGYSLLAKNHNKFVGIIPKWEKRSAEYYKSKADKDGFTSFQAWDFIQTFGSFTGLCQPQYYSNTVKFKSQDFEPCS